MALYVQFGNYNSPTPLVLFAPNHPRAESYSDKICLPLILTTRLGRGATGQVYDAKLGVGHERRISSRIVVKLAATRPSLLSLRHEYDIYVHLHSKDVTGIPFVFGYYHDADCAVGALIMSNAGAPFGRRMNEEKKIRFTAAEK